MSKEEISKLLGTPVGAVPPERCKCGHYKMDHENESGDCLILLCDCISFWPPSHNYDLRKEN